MPPDDSEVIELMIAAFYCKRWEFQQERCEELLKALDERYGYEHRQANPTATE